VILTLAQAAPGPTFDWLHFVLGLVAVFAPLVAGIVERKYGKNSEAGRVAEILSSSVSQIAHPETQATLSAKAGVAGLDEHPLVQQALAPVKG
jgi:hypothetical protein